MCTSPSITRRLLDAYAHRLVAPGQTGAERESRVDPARRARLEQLTPRELEVMLLVARSL